MRWHTQKRVAIKGILQHPADVARWKPSDREFSQFSSEPRNVHLGLASDRELHIACDKRCLYHTISTLEVHEGTQFFHVFAYTSPISSQKEINVYL